MRADAAGFLTVFPCDQPRPNASNLNFDAGSTIFPCQVPESDLMAAKAFCASGEGAASAAGWS